MDQPEGVLVSEWIEFTHSELSTSFGLFRTGPGRLKICNPAVGERVDENWLPDNAKPFYVPPEVS